MRTRAFIMGMCCMGLMLNMAMDLAGKERTLRSVDAQWVDGPLIWAMNILGVIVCVFLASRKGGRP